MSFALTYLRDVLGLRGVPVNMPAAVVDLPAPTSSLHVSPLAIWVDTEPSPEEKEMAEKMLAAIEYHNVDWAIGNKMPSAKAVVRFGEPRDARQILNLTDLSKFLAIDSRELKKEAWLQLKKFKVTIST